MALTDFPLLSDHFAGGKDLTDPEGLVKILNEVNTLLASVGTLNDYVIVQSKADLPTASGGFHQLVANCVYCFNGPVDIGTDYLKFASGVTVKGLTGRRDRVIYTGAGRSSTSRWHRPFCS